MRPYNLIIAVRQNRPDGKQTQQTANAIPFPIVKAQNQSLRPFKALDCSSFSHCKTNTVMALRTSVAQKRMQYFPKDSQERQFLKVVNQCINTDHWWNLPKIGKIWREPSALQSLIKGAKMGINTEHWWNKTSAGKFWQQKRDLLYDTTSQYLNL